MLRTVSAQPVLSKGKAQKNHSAMAMSMRRLLKNKSAMIGVAIVLLLAILAIFAPLIIPYGYEEINIIDAFKSPSAQHWFGTDDLGRDIFSRIIYGGRYSLRLGIMTVAVSMSIGVLLGALSGYYGGWVDQVIMRLMDILSAIPGMLLSIAIAAVLGTGFDKTVIALSIGSIPAYARMLRAQILSEREKEYLEASHAINCGSGRIIVRHLLPNTLSPLIVQASLQCATTLLAAAALSYIGLGVQPPEPEWGAMLSGARSYIRKYPHMLVFPGLFIMTVVVALNMFGDGLRDALDPKLKK